MIHVSMGAEMEAVNVNFIYKMLQNAKAGCIPDMIEH